MLGPKSLQPKIDGGSKIDQAAGESDARCKRVCVRYCYTYGQFPTTDALNFIVQKSLNSATSANVVLSALTEAEAR